MKLFLSLFLIFLLNSISIGSIFKNASVITYIYKFQYRLLFAIMDYLFTFSRIAACAAARRATGTLKGEQET